MYCYPHSFGLYVIVRVVCFANTQHLFICDVFIGSDFKESHLVFRVEDIDLYSDCMDRIQLHAMLDGLFVLAKYTVARICSDSGY